MRGCAQGFPGLASSRATTTAMIVNLPELSRSQLGGIHESLERQGWLAELDPTEVSEVLEDEIAMIG
jgi:hypothetical protein